MACSNCGGVCVRNNLPDGITSMGDSCVRNCDNLRSIRLPQRMDEVPPYFVSGCSRIRSLYLPEHLKVIRRDGLAGTGLDSISLPEGLESIERGAFWACLNLRRVRIPASVRPYCCGRVGIWKTMPPSFPQTYPHGGIPSCTRSTSTRGWFSTKI